MSQNDILKWDKKYAGSEALPTIGPEAEPEAELLQYLDLLPKTGMALDLACGLGKNALFLAQQGLEVEALDGSAIGLARLDHAARNFGLSKQVNTFQADLDEYQLAESKYDVIVVIRYLNRALFATIQAALKPGGVLFYKTFNQKVLQSRPSFNASFTIEQDSLQAGFPGLLPMSARSNEQIYSLLIARKQ